MTTVLDRRVSPPEVGSLGPVLPPASVAPWPDTYARALVLVDTAALVVAAFIGLRVRFGGSDSRLLGTSYVAIGLGLVLLWLGALGLGRVYETRFLSSGPEEFRRVFNASVRFAAAVAVVGYATGVGLARGFVAAMLPTGTVLLLLGRYAARLWVYRQRRQGAFSHRVLVIGNPPQAAELVDHLRHDPLAGLDVVGACIPGGLGQLDVRSGEPVPVVGSLSSVVTAMWAVNADTVAVAASPSITGEALRRLSYLLEGTGVDLLVAPALTNVTGTRLTIRPVAGLPLVHLDEPELTGARKLVKAIFDRTLAALALVLLLPVLVLIGVAVRLTSRGPALFRQQRVGQSGELFSVWKFRSMVSGAESQKAALLTTVDLTSGVLFKMRNDPRVTRLGRWLRKLSLDELPQLVNVLRGEMSLVGPRPPLATEVEQYQGHTHRRLLVKPGITGLWQVSGRSDLSWEDTVRLDLQYVENWSLGLDLAILVKTVLAVIKGRGAY